MTLPQILMIFVLLVMVTGRTPLYITAIVGSTIVALVAGFPIIGPKDVLSITSLLNAGLNPVIADMAGVLMFIGVMEKAGFLDVIVRWFVKVGRILGGGAGVTVAGGIAAGIIGMLTGFTQPAIIAVITGVASTKLGIDPNKSAGVHAHAGHLGNFGGFTHPTQVAVVATAGIGFGMINIIGIFVSLSIFACSLFRLKRDERKAKIIMTKEQIQKIAEEFETSNHKISVWYAFAPFMVLFIGFILGYPVFLIGLASALLTVVLSSITFSDGESSMLEGVSKIATPLVATIGFLFMASVIKSIGLASLIGQTFLPFLQIAPLQSMLIVSALTGLVTQSNAASAAIIIPFLQATIGIGADPFSAAVVAAGGSAIMQYYLTGGPVAALATVIPVIPGSTLKLANKFQRPSMLFGLFVLFIISFLLYL